MTIKNITLLHNKCRFMLNFSYRFICASNNSYMPRIRTCETSKPKHLKKLYEFGCYLFTDLHLKINDSFIKTSCQMLYRRADIHCRTM